MTVTNCNDELNATVNNNDGNISSNCNLEDNNELSDYGKAFDSLTYHQYLCKKDLQGVVTTPGVDSEGLFSGENMVNFVDNHSYEVCSEHVNNPVYDPHDWVSVNIVSQSEIHHVHPSVVSCTHNNDTILLHDEGVCIGELLPLCRQCDRLGPNNGPAFSNEGQVCKIRMINWVSIHNDIYVPTVYIHSTDLHRKFFSYGIGENGLFVLHCDNVVHQDILVTSAMSYAQLKIFDNNMQGLTLSPYQTFDNYQKDIWSYETFNMSYEQHMHKVIDELCNNAESPKGDSQSNRVDNFKPHDDCYDIINTQGESKDEMYHNPQLGTGSAIKLLTSSDKRVVSDVLFPEKNGLHCTGIW